MLPWVHLYLTRTRMSQSSAVLGGYLGPPVHLCQLCFRWTGAEVWGGHVGTPGRVTGATIIIIDYKGLSKYYVSQLTKC